MRKTKSIKYAFLILVMTINTSFNYDSAYVEISSVNYKNETFNVVQMKREQEKIKAKYFAAKDFINNKVVSERYNDWVKTYKNNVILVSSGTYMDGESVPVGLTIDNGTIVNKNLSNQFDGLVIVYASGGIVVSNLKDANLSVKGEGLDGKKLNLKGNAWDLTGFTKWAVSQEATVFQTHLLVYNNILKLRENGSPKTAERRFLAVGKDENGIYYHCIVHCPFRNSLYESSKKVLDFLQNSKDLDVTFMINLDTGAQDVFKLYNRDGSINNVITGTLEISKAANLLAYYFL